MVEMYDLAGKKCLLKASNNVRTESLKVNTNTLNTGVYFAKITTDEEQLQKCDRYQVIVI